MRSKHSFKKSEKAKVAQSMLAGAEMHDRLKDVFKRQPGGLLRVEVEYHDLSVETDGKVRRSITSLHSNAWSSPVARTERAVGSWISSLTTRNLVPSFRCRWGLPGMRRC